MATYRGMFLQDLISTEIDANLARGAAIEDLAFDFGRADDNDQGSTDYLSEYPFFQK